MIKLDLVPSCIKPVLHSSQYDEGRQWQCQVLNDGVPFVFQNGDTVEFSLRKGDGLVVTTNVAVTPGTSTITLVSTEQMCAVYGSNLGEFKINSNGVKVGSVNVILEVERDPASADKASRSEIWDLPAQVDACVKQELETVGAKLTGYDNTESGLDATNVQDALDELASQPSVDAYTKQESDAFITDEYDAESTYAIGDMVIHDNALYVCSTAITTAEAWNSAHWTLTDIATEIGTVKAAIPTKTSDLQNDSGFAQIDDTTESASKTYSSEKIEGEIKPIADTVGLAKTISGTASAVSVNTPYEIKNGKKYIINLTSGTIRLSTTKNGTVVDYILGSSSPDSAIRAPYKTEFTATGDADSLRVPYPTVPYSFTITPKDGLYNTVEELYENIDVGYIQTFTETGASYASRQVDIKEGITYIVNLTSGTLRLSTRATENGTDIDWIFGSSDAGSAVTAPAKVKFTATGDAGYLRVRADSACYFTVEDCSTTRGKFDLLEFDQVFSLSKYREDIYCPYPQLPANTDASSDFNAESVTAQDIYDYFDALVDKYPQLLTKTVMGKDSSNTYDVNRYVFADSTRNDYYATIYIGANEHGPQSDPREPAIVVARLFKDLCEGNAKTQRFLNLIKKYYKIVCIPVINPWGFNKSDGGRNNANNVNINRNYPTPAWDSIADVDKGSAPASEVETQYVINTISSFNAKIALDLHCLGYTNSANDMKCHYSGYIKDKFKINDIQNLMKRDYNLVCTSYGNGDYNTYANGSAYFRYIGIDGLLLEFQAQDGATGGLDTVQHDAFILEADYTFMLRILNYLISVYNPDLDTMKF